MTVNCKIWIETTADFDDIVFVMRAAAGNKVTQEVRNYGTVYRVDGRLSVMSNDFSPTMITVSFESPVRGGDSHTNIHLNQTDGRHAGQTFLGPVSNPFWGAIGKRLVEVFGGEIVYDDASANPRTFKSPRKKFMGADDGKKWQKRQHALGAVEPITVEEMREAELYTAWKMDDAE